jgi:5-methylthioadenosine/S-adenosylhomocysteine deaminase
VLLHDGAGKWHVERADVVVQDGRIWAVGRTGGQAVGGRGKVSVRDCSGCLVMPGLIQAHVHLCQTLFRGVADDLRLEDWLARRIWPLEAAHTEETIYWSALLGAAELLLGGTTAILDMETVRHTGAAFEALDRIGIRATAGKCLMDTHVVGAESLARRWHGAADGRLRWCFAPRFVPSCSGPLLRAASDLAERCGAQLHTHAAETIVERETVLRGTGVEEIAYLHSVGISGPRAAVAHCVWVDQHEIARLAAQGTTVVHCPSSNLKLGSGVAKVPEMLQAGCRVALGSDGAPCNNRLDGFAEMRLAALIQKPRHGADVLPAGQVLELATVEGARALGLADDIGAIAVGKRADLMVLDLRGPHLAPAATDPVSHLVYAAQTGDVRDVFVDGRPVVLDHELLTVCLEEILREAGRSAVGLRRRAGLG